MYIITKEFAFEAAHHLKGLPEGHQCARPHGHSYRVEVILRAEVLDQHGFVVDYGDLDSFAMVIKNNFDHRDLNEVFAHDMFNHPYGTKEKNTTAENLAYLFFKLVSNIWPRVVAVRVSETAKTWAEYRPTPGPFSKSLKAI